MTVEQLIRDLQTCRGSATVVIPPDGWNPKQTEEIGLNEATAGLVVTDITDYKHVVELVWRSIK